MERVDDLPRELLERPADQSSAGLEDLCAEHTGAARELRRRFEVLRRMGVAATDAGTTKAPPEPAFPMQCGP
ncbi:MAG: hypothetical protein R3F56_07545 [Planctomycetota bacterium]